MFYQMDWKNIWFFMLGKNLVFTGSMLFTNSSFENSVTNLPKNKLKYLAEEFIKKELEWVKPTRRYPCNIWIVS